MNAHVLDAFQKCFFLLFFFTTCLSGDGFLGLLTLFLFYDTHGGLETVGLSFPASQVHICS